MVRSNGWMFRRLRSTPRLNPRVALNVTIPKRIPFMPWFKIPAATIALNGAARVIAAKDADPGVIQALMARILLFLRTLSVARQLGIRLRDTRFRGLHAVEQQVHRLVGTANDISGRRGTLEELQRHTDHLGV
ncbi:MAG: hypothetical protein OES69_16555 [Myxococcales bacterium]|nr:hypothetical protein [Myxococcales bacterium]MDH3845551.1 hypothetical protein [Myxococcales bacterium]